MRRVRRGHIRKTLRLNPARASARGNNPPQACPLVLCRPAREHCRTSGTSPSTGRRGANESPGANLCRSFPFSQRRTGLHGTGPPATQHGFQQPGTAPSHPFQVTSFSPRAEATCGIAPVDGGCNMPLPLAASSDKLAPVCSTCRTFSRLEVNCLGFYCQCVGLSGVLYLTGGKRRLAFVGQVPPSMERRHGCLGRTTRSNGAVAPRHRYPTWRCASH